MTSLIYMTTIPSQFIQTASQHPNKDFLVAKKAGQWKSISYGQTADFVQSFAGGLLKLGLKQGDRVAILSCNRPAWVIVDLGVMTASGISVPIHTTLSPNKIKYILNDSGAKYLFVAGEENYKKFLEIKPQPKKLKKIIHLDIGSEIQNSANMISFEETLKLSDLRHPPAPSQVEGTSDIRPPTSDICSILYTSGTTGDPKGVMLSHENFLSNVQAALQAVPINSTDIFLSFLPLSHVLERTAGYYTPMSVGATIYYAENIKKLSDNLKEVRPTVLISVPRIFERVYEKIINKAKAEKGLKKKLFFSALKIQSEIHQASRESRHLGLITKVQGKIMDSLVCKKVRTALGGRLRFAVSGGASLSKQIAKFFENLGINIIEGYGLTETSPVITVNRLDNYEFGTVGLPLQGVEVKISPQKEILAKGPNVMSGYWQSQKATKEVLASSGWFSTGDLGFIDNRGFLTIIGRKKEIIVTSGGKNVSPEPVEAALQLSKFINQAMVIGNNRKFISALIVPDFEIQHNSTQSLIQHEIENQLHDFPDYEKPQKFTLIPVEFTQEAEELTPTLKLRRSVISAKYKKEIEAMYK